MTTHDQHPVATPLSTGERSRRAARTIDGGGAWDDDGDRRGEQGRSFAILLFVPCLLVLVAALWLMGYAVDIKNGVLFSVAMLAAGAAFMVPMHAPRG